MNSIEEIKEELIGREVYGVLKWCETIEFEEINEVYEFMVFLGRLLDEDDDIEDIKFKNIKDNKKYYLRMSKGMLTLTQEIFLRHVG